MRSILLAGAALLLGAGLAMPQAFAQGATNGGTNGGAHGADSPAERSKAPPVTNPGNTAAAPAGGNTTTADVTFIQKATSSGMAEVEEGQLAETKAQRAAVKSFAARMVADHTKADQQLQEIVQQRGITPATEPDAADTAGMANLKSLSGRAFDRAYVHDQISAHEQAIALFREEAQHGQDPALKQFAEQTLPTLREHLRMARGLRGAGESAS